MSVVPVVSLCAFPAGALLWEAQPGQLSLTVVVKATFALVPGELCLAPEQDPLREERHWDDNGMASVHWPGDYAPSKRRADLTLVGHAYAPAGDPVTALTARLTVGDLVKAVRVTGDRGWTMGADKRFEPGPPSPFLRMPLRYERAALSADNPIGIDVHAPPVVAMPALPNLEPVRAQDSQGSQVTPCFGPVAPTWRARRRLLDEAATFWAYGIARDPRTTPPPVGPSPQRFDFAFFNAAPADQQIDLFRPGTPIVLEHLHPRLERLETHLPPIRPQVFRVPPPDTPRARVEEIALRCDSLWIDTDRSVVVVTWRGLTDVGRGAEGVGQLVVAADPQGKKLHWDRVEKRLRDKSAPTLRLHADGLPPPEEAEETPPPDPLGRRHDTVKGQRGSDGAAAMVALPSADGGIEDAPTNPIERRRGKIAPRRCPSCRAHRRAGARRSPSERSPRPRGPTPSRGPCRSPSPRPRSRRPSQGRQAAPPISRPRCTRPARPPRSR